MTFAWEKRDSRYAPYHMVWLERNYNEPRFELRKYEYPKVGRAWKRLDWIVRGEKKFEWARVSNRADNMFPFFPLRKKRKRKESRNAVRKRRRGR